MDIGDMKNIVVLKNLPSNIIEEAIVVIKDKKMIKSVKKSNNNKCKKESKNSKDYILKEAEMVVTNYISNLEKQKQNTNKNVIQVTAKYKRLKYITVSLAILTLANLIIMFM